VAHLVILLAQNGPLGDDLGNPEGDFVRFEPKRAPTASGNSDYGANTGGLKIGIGI
jgi:hypothetical protein